MIAGVMRCPYLPRLFSGRLTKMQVSRLIFLHAIVQPLQSFFRETGADSTGEEKSGRIIVADQQSGVVPLSQPAADAIPLWYAGH